jgi:5-methylcytosine-specific restriction enzyme A
MPNRSPLHRPIGALSPTERRALYSIGHPSRSRHYNTAAWRRLRRAYLAAHPICECGCNRAATVVDHKMPHNGDRELLMSWDNLQAMTKPCHDRKTAERDGGFGNARR